MSGENPLIFKCRCLEECCKDKHAKLRCFNILLRPKIEKFADCLPGAIAFGDVDAIVEVNGHALMLEWKSRCGPIKMGQHIMYERLTNDGRLSVLCIVGSAETMRVEYVGTFTFGKWTEWTPYTFDMVKEKIRKWVKYAQARKRP